MDKLVELGELGDPEKCERVRYEQQPDRLMREAYDSNLAPPGLGALRMLRMCMRKGTGGFVGYPSLPSATQYERQRRIPNEAGHTA